MISVYLGKPGAGKSYSAMCLILQSLYSGRQVYTNLPIDGLAVAAFLASQRKSMTATERAVRLVRVWRARRFIQSGRKPLGGIRSLPANLHMVTSDYFHVPQNWMTLLESSSVSIRGEGPVIVLDEIGSILDAMVSNMKENKLDLFYKSLREHRHFYATLIFICQSHHQIDTAGRQVKALVEQWCEVVNFQHSAGMAFFERVVYTEHFGTGRVPVSRFRGRYRPEIFLCYRSHDLAKRQGAGELGIEQEVTTGKNRLVFFKVVGILVVAAVIAVVVMSFTFYDQVSAMMFGDDAEQVTAIASDDQGATSDTPATAAAPKVPNYFLPSDSRFHTRLQAAYPGLLFRPVHGSFGRWLDKGLWVKPKAPCRLISAPSGDYLACPKPPLTKETVNADT